MRVRPAPFTLLIMTLSAACGGGGGDGGGDGVGDGGGGDAGGTASPPPALAVAGPTRLGEGRGAPFADSVVKVWEYVPDTDVIVVPIEVLSGPRAPVTDIYTLTRTPGAPQVAGFGAYSDPANPFIVVRGETATGSGEAYVGQFGGISVSGIHLRLSDTVLPVSGTARMTGGYMGLISAHDDLGYRGYITGATELFADFDSMTIQGEITGRVNTNVPPRAFDPLILLASPIDAENGSFRGDTGGGILAGLPGFDGAPGTWGGLIVGPDGGEAVGSVYIVHERAGVPTFLETGAFVAD
jgi:hypothetical protein